MMTPIVVVIDDDLAVHHRLSRLMPEVRFVSAYHASAGLKQVRTLVQQGAVIALVLVDYRLPDMDGALLAARLRIEQPELRIAPLSSVDDADVLIGVSGTLPLIPKRLSDEALVERLRAALAGAPAKALDPTLARYLAEHAAEREAVLARDVRPQIALFTGSRPLSQLIAATLQGTQTILSCQTTSATTLRALLTHFQPDLLICDASVFGAAQSVADEHRLPLLLIAMSLSAAWAAPETVAAVVVDPEPTVVAQALDAALAGDRYRDPLLDLVPQQLKPSPAELRLLPFILRDTPLDEIADQLNLSYDSARKYRSALFLRLELRSPSELRAAIDALRSL